MIMEILYREKKRDFYNFKKYSAIFLDVGSASMIAMGIITNNTDLGVVGSCIEFASLFYSVGLILERTKIKKDKRVNDITRFLENQVLFE